MEPISASDTVGTVAASGESGGGARGVSFGSDARVLAGANFINAVIGALYWLIADRAFPIEEVGRATFMISVGTTTASLSLLATGQVLERFLPVAGRKAGQIIWLVTGVFAVPAVIACFLLGFFEPFSQWDAVMRFYFTGTVVIVAWFTVQDFMLNGLNQPRVTAMKNLTHAIVKALALGGLAVAGFSNGMAIVGSWVITSLVVSVFCQVIIAVVASRMRAEPQLPNAKQWARFHGQSFAWLVGQVLPVLIMPIIVKRELGDEQSAYFNVAFIVVNASVMIMQVLGGPAVARLSAPGEPLAEATRAFGRAVIVISVLRLLGVAVAGPVAMLIFGENYLHATLGMLVLLGIAHFIGGPGFMYACLSRVNMDVRFPMIVQYTGSALVVALAYFLVPRWGLTGVGFAYFMQDLLICLLAVGPLRVLWKKYTNA